MADVHVSLGMVVTAGARLEETLRACFCQRDGGEYSDIIAAGQDVSWLIEYCGDLVKANPALGASHKDAIRASLDRSKAASQSRNELIHGGHNWYHVVDVAPAAIGVIMRSRRHKPDLMRDTSVDEVRRVWLELHEAADQLRQAVTDAVGRRSHPRLLGLVDENGVPWY